MIPLGSTHRISLFAITANICWQNLVTKLRFGNSMFSECYILRCQWRFCLGRKLLWKFSCKRFRNLLRGIRIWIQRELLSFKPTSIQSNRQNRYLRCILLGSLIWLKKERKKGMDRERKGWTGKERERENERMNERKKERIIVLIFSGLDLALLSQANHSIMTYGTFGMWGTMLAGGQVWKYKRIFCCI